MASPTHIIAPSCSCTRFAGTQELRNAYGLRCACAAPALLRTHQGSPLHAAAAAAVERLPVVVAHGDAPLPVDACGSTPLHSAAAQGDPEAVHLLLRSCGERAAAECSALNWCGMTPIHSLAANPGPGSCAALSVMMHFGASLHDRTKPFGDNDDDDMGSFSGETALSLAAQHSGDHQAGLLVALLLQAGLDPLDPAGPMHTTPLEFASAAGDVEVVKLMLCYADTSNRYCESPQGCDEVPVDEVPFNPAYLLSLAVAHRCHDVAEFLLEPPPSFHALLTGQLLPDSISVLEGPGGSSCSRIPSEDHGDTATSAGMPTHQSYVDVDQPFLQRFQLDACLHRAIANGDLEMCRLLVAGGACGSHWRCDCATLSDWNETLERLGWESRFPELHDAEEPDYDETPLTLALRLHEFDTAAWLIKRTAAAYPQLDGKDRTALHWAARAAKPKLLRWLLETGLCSMQGEGHERIINRQDRRHHSALAYAIAAGDPASVELLCRHGASMRRRVMTKAWFGAAARLAI